MNIKRTALILATFAASTAFAQDPNVGLAGLVGKPAPKFKMTDIHGKVLTNQSLIGKVVVLDFWASWCGPCKQASPIMQKLFKKYGSRGLVIIGAETLENGAAPIAKAYASEHHYTYTFTTNNDGLTTKLGIGAIPAFVIIGKDGRVAKTETGVDSDLERFYTSFEKLVKPLLK